MTHTSTRILLVMLLFATAPGLSSCSRKGMDVVGPDVGSRTSEVASGESSVSPMFDSKLDGAGSRLPDFDPGDFVRKVDNPYFPLTLGTQYRYAGETDEGLETIEIKVTRDTKRIMGVETIVVRDQAFLDGSLIEDTFDYYAQDEDGHVWYFGEDTKTLEDGVVVSTAGSWRAGKNGARPGIVMLAHPRVGQAYPQERAPGVAEDRARVVSLKKSVSVPYGKFERCLQTFDDTPLDPEALEFKYYARGVGLVLEVSKTSGERIELNSVTRR